MSVYNGERWLNECIRSVLKQSFLDFEFLIIDDGSTDNSLEIIKKYKKQDQRIKIISQKNIGLTKSLAKGVSLSNGDWIARIDCDDICEKDRFKEQYQYAKKNNFHLVGSFAREITTDDKLGKQ